MTPRQNDFEYVVGYPDRLCRVIGAAIAARVAHTEGSISVGTVARLTVRADGLKATVS